VTLDRAIEAGIFEEAPGGLRVHFRHALVREALYGEIGILQRRDWHRATADGLIAMPQPDPDNVITHLDPAGDERLADWLVRSGDRAMSRFAWDTAVERFAEASRLLEQQDISDPLRMCQVLLKLGDAQNKAGAGRGQTQGAGNDPQALQTFWKVAGIARRAGLPEQLAEAALGIAGVNTQASHGGPEGFSLMHEALAMLPEQDSALRARLLVRLATGAAFHAAVVGMIDIASAEQVDERSNSAVAMARRLGDPETLAYTLQCRGVVIIGCPYSAERRANTEEFLRLAVQINDLTLEARARYDRVTDLSLAGDLDAARDEFTRYERVVERLHMPVFEWFADVHRAGEHLSAGRYVETKRGIDKIEATWPNSVAVRAQRVALYRETGDLNGMREATVSVESAPLALALRLQCLPECGELDAVREQFEAFIDSGYLFEELPKRSLGWWRIVAIAAETCAALDDAWRAGKIYEHLRPFDGLNNFAGYSQYSMGAVAHHLGLLAATIRDWNVAERHFSRALEQNDHWGYRPAASYTRFEWAAMLHRREQRGDRERARALLGQALATANELGMVRLKRLATVLARKVGILDQAHPAGLSSRELEVLELVAEGLTNAEIGAALYISPRTVAQHLRSVYNKLGVNSRAAAVGRWADLRNT
jgi:DNA-binding CsgD family transcriptional regulator